MTNSDTNSVMRDDALTEMQDQLVHQALSEHFGAQAYDEVSRDYSDSLIEQVKPERPPLRMWPQRIALAAGIAIACALGVLVVSEVGSPDRSERSADNSSSTDKILSGSAASSTDRTITLDDGPRKIVQTVDLAQAKQLLKDAVRLEVSSNGISQQAFLPHDVPLNASPDYVASEDERKQLITLLTSDLKKRPSSNGLKPKIHLHFVQSDGSSLRVILENGVFNVSGIDSDLHAPAAAYALVQSLIPKAEFQAKVAYGIVNNALDASALPEDATRAVLTALALSGNKPDANWRPYASLDHLTGLQHLGISGTTSTAPLSQLAKHTSLESLHISGDSLSADELAVLSEFSRLQQVFVSLSGGFGTDVMQRIAAVGSLKNLSLKASGVPPQLHSNEAVAAIASLRSLRTLGLYGVAPASAEAFAGWDQLESLEQLTISDASLGDDEFAALQHFPKLTHLDLSGNDSLSDQGLSVFAIGKESLTHLNLSRCSRVGDKAVGAIANAYENTLEVLNLTGTAISDAGVKALVLTARVHTLSLSDTAITDVTANHIWDLVSQRASYARTNDDLRHLDVSGCKALTSKFPQRLTSIPGIKKYIFFLCDSSLTEACKALADRNPGSRVRLPDGTWYQAVTTEPSIDITPDFVPAKRTLVAARDLKHAKRLLNSSVRLDVQYQGTRHSHYFNDQAPLNTRDFYSASRQDQRKLATLLSENIRLKNSSAWLAPAYILFFVQPDGSALRVVLEDNVCNVVGLISDVTAPGEAFQLAASFFPDAKRQMKLAHGVIESKADSNALFDAFGKDVRTLIFPQSVFGKTRADGFSGQPLPELERFSGVKNVVIDGQIREERLRHLEHCKDLRSLKLMRTIVDGDGLNVLTGLKQLREVTIVDGNYSEESWQAFSKCAALKSLHIERPISHEGAFSRWSDKCLQLFATARGLQELTLIGVRIVSGAAFDGWERMASLESLTLQEASLETQDLTGLAKIPFLQRLDLTGNEQLTDATLARLLSINKKYTHLSFAKCKRVGFESMRAVGERQRDSLTSLNLSDTAIDDKALAELEPLEKLKVLRLSGTKLSAKAWKHITAVNRPGPIVGHLRPCPIETLDLERIKTIDNDFVDKMSFLDNLKEISFFQCDPQITDACQELAVKMPETAICLPAGTWLNR